MRIQISNKASKKIIACPAVKRSFYSGIVSLLFTGLLFAQTPVKAQTQDQLPELPSSKNPQTGAEIKTSTQKVIRFKAGSELASKTRRIKLPNAGLTPASPFYFLDIAAEAIREFLTFDAEAKAKLQAERALERIAEVKAMLAEKEVNPKGLNVALDRLQANVSRAAEIVQKEQQKGRNVSKLAKDLDTDFEVRERLLKQILEEKKDQLELDFKEQKFELKKQLIEAKIARNTQKVGEIVLALDKLEQEKERQESLLEQKEGELDSALVIEEEKFELAMEQKERKLEQKEKEAELAFEKKRQELEKQFEEAKRVLEDKEKALEDQLETALSLGDEQEIERIKAQLLAIETEQERLDAKLEESEKSLEEVEQNLEALRAKEERNLEEFEKQQELISEKANSELKKAIIEKERALESRFEAKKRELEIKEKQLKIQILKAKQACQQAADPAVCIRGKVEPLQEKMSQIKVQKKGLDLEKEKTEQAIGIEKERIKQELELKEKELELQKETRERALEAKEEELERLQEKRKGKLEEIKEEQERQAEQGQEQGEQGKIEQEENERTISGSEEADKPGIVIDEERNRQQKKTDENDSEIIINEERNKNIR